jgi:hypothetical protein
MIYKHKTVKSLIKKGMSMDEVTEETWIAVDKGYVEEIPTGFRLTTRGIDAYRHLKLEYTDDVTVPKPLQKAYAEEQEDFIPLLAVI